MSMNDGIHYTEAWNRLSSLNLNQGAGSVLETGKVLAWSRSFVSKSALSPDSPLLPGDRNFNANTCFTYWSFKPLPSTGAGMSTGKGRGEDLIILLHGLNERSWQKYLPWAEELALLTGKAVVLFPIAFHMQRSPGIVNERDALFKFYRDRKSHIEGLDASSHANAILSDRLQSDPARFYRSGLQTYRDLVDFVSDIRSGVHPDFGPGSRIDLFGYSIGAFLSEILLMANPDGLFGDCRLFAFCGGSIMEMTNPLSRAILDSAAVQAILSFFARIGQGLGIGPDAIQAKARASAQSPSGEDLSGFEGPHFDAFRMMLNDTFLRREREARLDAIGSRIAAVALERDTVIPPLGVRTTLGSRATVKDFPYVYKHETPFPLDAGQEAVDAAFTSVFEEAGEFLS